MTRVHNNSFDSQLTRAYQQGLTTGERFNQAWSEGFDQSIGVSKEQAYAIAYQLLLLRRYQEETWRMIAKVLLAAFLISIPGWVLGIWIWKQHEADMAIHSQKMQQLYLQEKQLNADRCEFLKRWPVEPNPHIPAALGWLDRDYRDYAKDLDKTCSLAQS